MASGGPLTFTDVPSPPLPAQQLVQGGGKLLSFGGQPYWQDTSGTLWALTSAGAEAVAWAPGGGDGRYLPLSGGTVTGQFSRTAFNWWSLDSFAGTDDQKMTSALAQVVSAGGGTIELEVRAHSFANQWTSAYVSSSVTTAIRIIGQGVAYNGAWGAPSAATVCTFTYSGAGAACIDMQHNGSIEITGIQFKSANLGVPLFQTTNATPDLHDNIWSGGGSGVTCATDAILLGGTGNTIGSGDTAPYQGYQGCVTRNFFDGIRRAVHWQTFANSVQVYGNTVSDTCGSNLYLGAPFELTGISGSDCSGNALYGNCIETGHYAYGCKAYYSTGNTLGPNGFFDMGSLWQAAYYIDVTSSANQVTDGFRTSVTQPLVFDTSTGIVNTLVTSQNGAGQFSGSPVAQSFYSNTSAPQSFCFGVAGIGVESTGNQGYWRTYPGANPYPVVQAATIAATQFTDATTVTGSRWVTSATAVFALADVGQAIGGTGISSQCLIARTVTSSTAFTWQASAAYNLGDIVRPTASNSHLYQCSTAGTTGGTQPTWPTGGGTVTDGTAVWTDLGTGITAAYISKNATATGASVTIGLSRSGGSLLTMTGFSRHHIVSTGTAPSWTVDTAGGSASGGTIAVASGGSDLSQEITLTTGSSVNAGQLCHGSPNINFGTRAPKVSLTPRNAAAATLMSTGGGVWVTTSTSQWTISTNSAPAASTAYIFDIISME